MLNEITLFGNNDKVKRSIEILKTFEPKDEPYWLAFSGGKDSVCILELAKMAGVKYEAVYNVTSVDPPELVQFIKNNYKEVRFDIAHDKDGKPITMWNLIPKKKMPPTQLARYCCEVLKEKSGKGRITTSGVRKAESSSRKNSQGVVTIFDGNVETGEAEAKKTERGGVILNDENDESRRVVEQCYRTTKTLVNPIIDWSDDDVWEFIKERNIPYCSLYDEGFKRLGCIGCPMKGKNGMTEDFKRYPKYKEMYLRAFDRMINGMKIYRQTNFTSAEDVFDWWVNRGNKKSESGTTLFDGDWSEE